MTIDIVHQYLLYVLMNVVIEYNHTLSAMNASASCFRCAFPRNG